MSDETIGRTVGRRSRPKAGIAPRAARREALATMARYRTRVPKGVFRYDSHEAANADWERWRVDAVVARAAVSSEG